MTPPETRDPPYETECRRPDGPHRAYQHPRRFDLRAAAGSTKARPQPFLLYARQALAARRGAGGAGAASHRARRGRRPFYARRSQARAAAGLRRHPAAAGPALRPRLHYLDALPRTHPSQNAGGEQSGLRARRAGKTVRDELSAADAADADLARPG